MEARRQVYLDPWERRQNFMFARTLRNLLPGLEERYASSVHATSIFVYLLER